MCVHGWHPSIGGGRKTTTINSVSIKHLELLLHLNEKGIGVVRGLDKKSHQEFLQSFAIVLITDRQICNFVP
jgi:hypothetical protein